MATPNWQVRGSGGGGGLSLAGALAPVAPHWLRPWQQNRKLPMHEISTLRKNRFLYERYKHASYLATRKRLIALFFWENSIL